MPYGDKLESARKKKNLTNFQMAAGAGLAPATINRLKKSSRKVMVESIDKAAAQVGFRVVINLVPVAETSSDSADS